MSYEPPIPGITTIPTEAQRALPVRAVPATIERISFTKTLASSLDTDFFTEIINGTGITRSQSGGNAVLTSGTTARSESIWRSIDVFNGAIRLRQRTTLSQRIVNNNFIIELVDVIGDALAYTISSATVMTVTFPSGHGITSENVGQFVSIGAFAGTGTFLSGRYAIASVAGDVITFTVSGFAAGTGTCSAFGRNFYRQLYDGVTATSMTVDVGRNGYSDLGALATTINTTATPGHLTIATLNDTVCSIQDQLIASSATIAVTDRGTRATTVPDDANLRLQIRILNGTTAPASTTTWTIGQISVSNYSGMDVVVQDVRPQSAAQAMKVEVTRTIAAPTQPVSLTSTTITSQVPGTAATNLGKARDSAIGATDTGVAILGVRRDTPTAETPVAGDYVVPQVSANGEQWVRLAGELADDAPATLATTRVVPVGGVSVSMDGTDPLAVSAEGDAALLRSDPNRILLVNQTHPRFFRASVDYASAQTNTTVVAAPGASLSLYITDIVISNGATAGNITLLDGSGGSLLFEVYPAINGGVAHSFRNPIKLTANTLLAITSQTVTTHAITVTGYIAA